MKDVVYNAVQFCRRVAGLAVAIAVGAAFGLAGISTADGILVVLLSAILAAGGDTEPCAAMAADPPEA